VKRLEEIPLFRGIAADELEENFKQIVWQRKVFTRDNLIASQGESCDRLLILVQGVVKTEMTDPTGKSMKIEDLNAPTVLAPAFIFGGRANFPVNIEAVTEVEIFQIPRPELLKLFQLNQKILQNFLGLVSSRAQFLSEKLRFHSFKSLKAKIAYYLLNEAGHNRSFRMKHSQNELAELFAVARPSVGRIFLQLQEEGFIDARYKEITILDANGLSKLYKE
jgi:CRP/FNR family transcriptional regulator, dissimilatory nitrate respiration regulator